MSRIDCRRSSVNLSINILPTSIDCCYLLLWYKQYELRSDLMGLPLSCIDCRRSIMLHVSMIVNPKRCWLCSATQNSWNRQLALIGFGFCPTKYIINYRRPSIDLSINVWTPKVILSNMVYLIYITICSVRPVGIHRLFLIHQQLSMVTNPSFFNCFLWYILVN